MPTDLTDRCMQLEQENQQLSAKVEDQHLELDDLRVEIRKLKREDKCSTP